MSKDMAYHASPIPARLTAGDDWSFTLAALGQAWPAPGYSLSLLLAPEAGGNVIEVPGSFADDIWIVSVAAATTGAMLPGAWSWAIRVQEDAGSAKQTVARGGIGVLPDPAADGTDTRADAERILAAIEARIEGRITRDADSYSIEGRSISRMPIEQLLRLRSLYQREVQAVRAARAGRCAPLFTQRRMRIT